MGREIVGIALPDDATIKTSSSKSSAETGKLEIRSRANVFVEGGLVALIEKTALDPEEVEDWMVDGSDLSWSIPLDGDTTLAAQVLLQEQGYRLYPNYTRFAVQSILQSVAGKPQVTDY